MKAYILIRDKELDSLCHTSLSETCKRGEVSYHSAIRGKRCWVVGNKVVEIKEIEVVKIVGRGKGFKKNLK